ncbi:MAG: T9SS type A sorting domain-containing protein [Paludibacter sp.]
MKKLIILIVMLAALLTGNLQAQSSVNTSTSGTWTCPSGVTKVTIECWGGGGAGGSAKATTANAKYLRTGGGAGGSYSKVVINNPSAGNYSYTVGAGGIAATTGNIADGTALSGQTGGTTSLTTLISAVGGPGGANILKDSPTLNYTSAGATSLLTGNTGDSFHWGGNGGTGGSGGAGGGGGSAGSTGDGGAGAALTGGAAGTGGGAAGGTVPGTTGVVNGVVGGTPGAGGSGSQVRNAVGFSAGGAGAPGKIIINCTFADPIADNIAYGTTAITKSFGNAAFTNGTLTTSSDGAITYGSSNSGVASVDAATGLVTLVSVGSATITASQAAGTGYLAGSASYTVTVNAVLTASTPSPAPLYYEAGVSASNEATFTLTGAGLTNDVLLAPNTNVDVSLTSGSGFVSNPSILTVPLASLSGGTVTIYVRLRSGIQPGGTGTLSRTITISSTGATTTTAVLGSGYITGLQISGTGPTSTYALGAGPGDEKSFIVRGNGLETTTQVSLAFGSNIEVTTTAGNYSTPITSPVSLVITPGAIPLPSIGPTTYYYRLKSGLSAGIYADATTKVSLSADGSSSLTGAFTTKVLQVTGTVTTAPTISFALATENKTLGDAAFTQTPTSNSAGAITYSSGSTGVATVDASTGLVTIVGVGSAVITASQAANGYYTSGSSTYTVVVAANVSSAENISLLALPASGSVTVKSTGTLTIDQDASGITINVQPGGKVTLADTKVLTSSTLTLQSDATGNATFVDNGGTITGGTMNVQQYLTSGRNWYISSPVSGATSNVFSASVAHPVYWYDEANGTSAPWATITNTTTDLTVMKGYVANLAASGVVTFSGTLNTGAKEITVYRTAGQTKEGFNLVGNPYPCYLDWSNVTKTNLSTTLWYRTKSAANSYVFDTYNANGNIATSNGTKAVTNLIPPMQAFWVRVDAGQTSGTLAVTNTQRAHVDNSSNTFKAKAVASQSVLRLEVSNGINSDQALVNFNSSASNGLDSYDSPKLSNESASIPEIYTLAGTEQVVINGVNDASELTLGFTSGEAGNFSIKASQFTNFATGTQIVLRDNLLNYEQDLTLADYNFYSDVTANNETRFTVLFKAPSVATGINPNTTGNVWISINGNNQIVVNGANAGTTVAVYNEVGQRLSSQTLTATTKVLNTKLASGVYMVTVTNAGKSVTQKVISRSL